MTDTQNRPVGLLDSGFGGLSVTRAVRAALPHEDLVFAADCGFAPWGDRTDDFILERCGRLVEFLEAKNIKALVLACNTATAVCAAPLRARLSIPVVGIEPAVFPAVRETETGVVGVIATAKTVASAKYGKLAAEALAWAKDARGLDVKLFSQGCPGLMECVERGDFEGEETLRLIEAYVAEMRAAHADRIVLGCTHYPFLSDAIARAMPDAELLDPAPAVAQQLVRRLTEEGLLRAEDGHIGSAEFFATGADAARETVLQALWPGKPTLHELP